MEYTKRFEYRYQRFCWNYRIKWESRKNPYDNKYWEYEDVDYLCICQDQDGKWFGTEDLMYDLHTYKSVTIFGIQFGKGYSWQAERIK